ncbi:DUF6647 family protein [Ovoidimarina sediminis]|uniref:DUF6647 family protein n=1 Tax=Ovoidimarina sediminis TaxID=3079856 RepID=UPI00292F60A3|nr:DUF6647 family protein [Rhodophyticola sp. MJ-SS7]
MLTLALAAEPAISDNTDHGRLGCPEDGSALERAVAFLEDVNMAPSVIRCPKRTTDLHLARLYFGGDGGDPGNETVAALYVRATGEILIDAKTDFRDPVDLSFFVHELVHSRQMEAPEATACVGVLEAEAYAIQAAFLRKQARPREALLFDLMGQLQAGCASRY